MGTYEDVKRFEAALRTEVRLEMARINVARAEAGEPAMSMSDLCRLSGISTSQMSRLMKDEAEEGRNNHWTVLVVLGMATALGLAPSELTERAQRRYDAEV